MALSFARDIRPMFRNSDVETMQNYGLDLSSYDEVKNKVQAIYTTLSEGTMPCDGAWPKDRVEALKRWMDEGMAPSTLRSSYGPMLDESNAARTTPAKCLLHGSRSLIVGRLPGRRGTVGNYQVRLRKKEEVAENAMAFYFEKPLGFQFDVL
jgi:hypothetical protein